MKFIKISLLTFFLAMVLISPYSANGEDVSRLPSLAKLAKELKPTVVNISSTKLVQSPLEDFFKNFRDFRDFFGEEFFQRFFGERHPKEFRQQSLGSGFIIDREGYIITNWHVIEKAEEIKVKLSDKKIYDAEVVGKDPKTDLALIKIKIDEDLPVARLGDSDKLEVGDWVVAIGNPFGLEHTVTTGIISAKGRVIGAGPYDDFLQTDASINPGNSGGPLFNLKGEVVGINTAIIAGGQGIGFAIPINMAKRLLPQLKRGRVVYGYLGVYIKILVLRKGKQKTLSVTIGELKEREVAAAAPGAEEVDQWGMNVQDITQEMASHLGLPDEEGVVITEVQKGSAAQEAKLSGGDVIIEIEHQKIKDMKDYLKYMELYKKKEALLLTVRMKAQDYHTLFVVLKRKG